MESLREKIERMALGPVDDAEFAALADAAEDNAYGFSYFVVVNDEPVDSFDDLDEARMVAESLAAEGRLIVDVELVDPDGEAAPILTAFASR